MNLCGRSGFQKSSEMSQQFEFSAPSSSNLTENSTFSSFSSISKPKNVKSRKYSNTRLMGSLETRKVDTGSNPFRPVLDSVTGGSSRLDGDAHLKFNVMNKVENVGRELDDELRKLRIENPSNMDIGSKGVDTGLPVEIPLELERLSLGGSCPVASVGSRTGDGSRDGGSVGWCNAASLEAKLPVDLKRLSIRDDGEAGGRHFASSGPGKDDFVLGSSSRTEFNDVNSVVNSTHPDKIRNLKIGEPGRSNVTRKAIFANDSKQALFSSGSKSVSSSSVVVDNMVLDEMEKLNITVTSEGPTDNANMRESSFGRKPTFGGVGEDDCRKSNCSENVSNASQVPELTNKTGLSGESVPLNSNSSPGGFHFQTLRGEYQMPCSEETEMREGFSFTGKQEGTRMPNVEFKTREPKGILFTGSNMNLEFCSKKGSSKVMSRGRKGKVKESNPVLVSLANNFSPMETSMQHEQSNSYSPMDVSPCRETRDDAQSGGEPSVTSNDSANEELATETEYMNTNENDDLQPGEAKEHAPECRVDADVDRAKERRVNVDVDRANLVADCVSTTEDVSFKSAVEDLDNDRESEVESKYQVESYDQSQYFSTSSSVSSGGSGSSFTFAASSFHNRPASATRHNIKKNQMKAGSDICSSPRTASLSDATSSLQFPSISRVSLLPSHVGWNVGVSNAPLEGGINTKIASPTFRAEGFSIFEDFKKEITSPTAIDRGAQEACEKWRLRGNQAYAHGDLNKAEHYYTQGLSCIPRHATSRDCLQSLVLCYSNRAATRMSLGRMRAALGDCLVAAEIDPTFLKVQLRAANCYLALGETGDASHYFKKLLQSTDACLERKFFLEASAGVQKSQKVSECMDQSILLLRQRTLLDVERVLEIIADALVISPYSELLLEYKAEALFMVRRYEEVIQLCEQTLEAAENNSSISCSDELLSNSNAEILENYSFRTWRYSFIFKSNFYLGKLEEAFEFLEKQEHWRSMLAKSGNEALESLIPQILTARELLRHKSAGNGAFQTGRHTEAVEHYNAALSFNVESRPFTAVCFGNRAAAYQALGQITDAVADCSLAIALDGNYLKAISRRATLFEMIKDYYQAAKDLQKFISLLTKQAEATSNPASLADLRQARQRLYEVEEYAKRGIPLNFYFILGVEQSVTATDLKKAYRKAALRHHPDKVVQSLARSECGDDGLWKEISEEVYKDADKLFKMIGEAYAVLSDPTKRSQYDIDEEMRNGIKKNGNSMSRMPNDASNHAEQRDGVGQWREGRRPSANPYSRGFEPTRPGRYY